MLEGVYIWVQATQNPMNLSDRIPFALQTFDEACPRDFVAEETWLRRIIANNLATFYEVDAMW